MYAFNVAEIQTVATLYVLFQTIQSQSVNNSYNFLLIDQFCIMPELLNPCAGLDPYTQHMYSFISSWLLISSNLHITLPQ